MECQNIGLRGFQDSELEAVLGGTVGLVGTERWARAEG